MGRGREGWGGEGQRGKSSKWRQKGKRMRVKREVKDGGWKGWSEEKTNERELKRGKIDENECMSREKKLKRKVKLDREVRGVLVCQ